MMWLLILPLLVLVRLFLQYLDKKSGKVYDNSSRGESDQGY